MGRQPRNEVIGDTYHVFFRGNRGEKIFRSGPDYRAFLKDLEELSKEHKVSVLAYCLMPNHAHLCLRTNEGGTLLEKLMQRLNLRHAKRYNWAYGVRGRLNEGRYQAKVIKGDDYLLTVVRYIHLNPVRARLVASPLGWRYSSHSSYLGDGVPWVETKPVLDLLGGVEGYRTAMRTSALTPEELARCRLPQRAPRPAMNALEQAARDLAAADRASLYAGKGPRPQSADAQRALALELREKGFSAGEIASGLDWDEGLVERWLADQTSEDEAVYSQAA